MPKTTERGAVATSQPHNSTVPVLTQEDKILEHLKRHGSITSMEAFRKYNITRLSGRIYDLRMQGYQISLVWETTPKGIRYGRYVLKQEETA